MKKLLILIFGMILLLVTSTNSEIFPLETNLQITTGNTPNWYYIDISDGVRHQYIGVDINDRGAIGIADNSPNRLIGRMWMTSIYTVGGVHYLCPIRGATQLNDFKQTTNSFYFDIRNPTIQCYEHGNLGNVIPVDMSVQFSLSANNNGEVRIKVNTTLNEVITPDNTGFAFWFVAENQTVFKYAKINGQLVDVTGFEGVVPVDKVIEFYDENQLALGHTFDWSDMLDVGTQYSEIINVGALKTILFGTYGYGSNKTIEIDPIYAINYTTSPGQHLINGTVTSDNDGSFNYTQNITIGLSDNLVSTNYLVREYSTIFNIFDAVFLYNIDETTGSTIDDASLNNIVGTLNGIPNLSVNGISNTGIELDGTTDYIYTVNDASMDIGSSESLVFCISFNTTNGSDDRLFKIDHSIGNDKIETKIKTGIIETKIRRGGAQVTASTIGTYNDGNWYKYCMSHDTNIINVTIDGVQVATGVLADSSAMDFDSGAFIGADTNSNKKYTGILDEACMWKGNNLDVSGIISNYQTNYCNIVTNSSEGIAISGYWNELYDSNWYWFLRFYKATSGSTNITVYAYNDSENISNQYVTKEISGTGWMNINITSLMEYMNNTINLSYTKLRLWSVLNQNISEIRLRKEIDDNTSPVVVNCSFMNADISCDETASWNCTVTDFLDVDSVTFTINGINYSAIQNGNEWYYDMLFTDTPPIDVDENFTLTDVYATDIVGNVQHNSSLYFSINHECDKTFKTIMKTPTQDFIILDNDTFLMKCNISTGTLWRNNTFLQVRHTNGTLFPLSSGLLYVNESANFSCGNISPYTSCEHTWLVTGGEFGNNNNIECYAISNPTNSSSSIRVDIVGDINTDLTMVLDDDTYISGTDSTAQMTTKFTSVPYNMVWYNSTGRIVCNDSGITPAVAEEIFFESCTLSQNTATGMTAFFYLHSIPTINVSDTYDIVAIGPNEYGITDINIKYTNAFLEQFQAIRATVIDNESNLAIGECCKIQIDDASTGVPIFVTDILKIDGIGHCEVSFNLAHNIFEAPKSYLVGINALQCSDEDLPAPDRYLGSATTSFATIQYIDESASTIPVLTTHHTSGFDTVTIRETRTNNWGVPMEVIQDVWFANTITEQDFHFDEFENIIATANIGITIVNEDYRIPQNLETGTYRIEKNIYYYYQGDLKEVQFVKSDEFNITSIHDTFSINNIEVKDFFGAEVNTSTVLLNDSSMPISNYTHPYVLLAEGFGYQVCFDVENNYNNNIYLHLQNMVLFNPTTGQSFEEFNNVGGDRWQRVLQPNQSKICWQQNMPLAIETHSDWQFVFDMYIGDKKTPYNCDICEFSNNTDYFYAGAIEDVIQFKKWYIKPNATHVGVPLTYIVTQNEEYSSMNDDCKYKNQDEIPWGTANVTCLDKNDGTPKLIDYSIYPTSGEQIKTCFQIHNYMSDEIDLELYDIYIDSDKGETVIFFQDEDTEGYISSIIDDKNYVSQTPSRAEELGGTLIDSYGIFCTKWIDLPDDTQGGNNWDIQGKVRINRGIYDLDEEVVWNWESDEFPIFGILLNRNWITFNDEKFPVLEQNENEFLNATYYAGIDQVVWRRNATNNYVGLLESIVSTVLINNDTGQAFEEVGEKEHERSFEVGEKSNNYRFNIASDTPGGNYFVRVFFTVSYNDVQVATYTKETEVFQIIPWEELFIINNITTSIGGSQTACTLYNLTLNYDDFIGQTVTTVNEELFILRICYKDSSSNEYINCKTEEIHPDGGTNINTTHLFKLPYVISTTQTEIDVWVYSYDSSNKGSRYNKDCLYCGQLIDFFGGDEGEGTFTTIADLSDSCKYTETFDQELLYRQIVALELQNTLKQQELNRWIIE